MSVTSALDTVAADVKAVEADVSAFITEVETAVEKVVAWVEKVDPNSVSIINALAASAKTAASSIATEVAKDATGAVAGLVADIETALANYASAVKLPTANSGEVQVVIGEGVQLLETLGNDAISVGLSKILALV